MNAIDRREVVTEAMLCAADAMTGHDLTDRLPVPTHHAEMTLCSFSKDHTLPLRARVALWQQLPLRVDEDGKRLRPKHLRPSRNAAGDWTDDGHGSMPMSISTIARLCRLEPDEERKLYAWMDARYGSHQPDYDTVLDAIRAALARADAGKEWDEKREGMIDFIRSTVLEDPRASAEFDTLDHGDSGEFLAHVSEEYEAEAQLVELDPVDDPLATLEVQSLRSQLRVLHDEIARERADIRGHDVDEWRASDGSHDATMVERVMCGKPGSLGSPNATGDYSGPAYADLSEVVACNVKDRTPVTFAVAWHQQTRANSQAIVACDVLTRKEMTVADVRRRRSCPTMPIVRRTPRQRKPRIHKASANLDFCRPADYREDAEQTAERVPIEWAEQLYRKHNPPHRDNRKEKILAAAKRYQLVVDTTDDEWELTDAKERLAHLRRCWVQATR